MDSHNTRPMSYDSLKILLQYAKPNLRFELSRRIPSIRLTEKAVPLKIDKLSIGSHGVEVNGIKYEAHTIRHFPPNIIASKHLLYESREGDWDLNEWGFDDFSSETVFTPGDLILQVEGQEPRQKKQDEEYRKSIEREFNLKTSSFSMNVQKPESDKGVESLNLSKSLDLTSSKQLKQKIEDAEVLLAPFKYVENNVPLPFTKMVQVAIRSENGSLCWNYSGNLKHYEVRKQLMTWLLGNRKPKIQVRDLVVINGIIARLPQNLRMSVKTLKTQRCSRKRILVDTNTMFNKLEAIIQNDNRPLDVFETYSMKDGFDHPMITNAKKLIVSNRWSAFPDANRLIRVPNRKLHIQTMSLLALDEIIPLIENWIGTPQEIGKSFSFEVRNTPLREAMAAVREHFDGIKTEKSIEIPVNNFSQIKVSYEDDEIEDWDMPLRLLTIEVEAV